MIEMLVAEDAPTVARHAPEECVVGLVVVAALGGEALDQLLELMHVLFPQRRLRHEGLGRPLDPSLGQEIQWINA